MKKHGYTPLVAGTVTITLCGSSNTTPCDVAAIGTTNVALNCKSVSPTASGNKGIVTRAVVTPSRKSTSLGVGSKYG